MKKLLSYAAACIIISVLVFVILHYLVGVNTSDALFYAFLVIIASLGGEWLGPKIMKLLSRKRA